MAVSRLLAEDEHVHGAGHGHEAPADPATVQRALLDKAMRSPSQTLPQPTQNELGDFYGREEGFDYSALRKHTGPDAQAAVEAFGAQAITVGNHMFGKALDHDRNALGHEAGHVLQQAFGPVAGTDNGARVAVSDPAHPEETSQDVNGKAFAAGAAQAPVPVQRASATGGSGSSQAAPLPAQRMDSPADTAVTQALAVQRMPRERRSEQNGSDDSGLAYGSLPGSSRSSSSPDLDLAYGPMPGPADNSFSGTVGDVHFTTGHNGEAMRELRASVAELSEHFRRQLEAAGSLTVKFGNTEGRTPGEWQADNRTIMLRSSRDSDRLLGTAVFEILNASRESDRAALERRVADGTIDRLAAQDGRTPKEYFVRGLERIEWENGMTHKRIMAAAHKSGTAADLFSDEPGDFESFYERQTRPGPSGGPSHTHSYEFRFDLLRVQAASAHQASSSGHGQSSSSGHRHSGSGSRRSGRQR